VLHHATLVLASPRLRVGRGRSRPQRAVELDERWSFVGAKATERWLWHAIAHHTGRVLAYGVGTRKDAVCLQLRALLAPFGITRYYTDKAGVYQRHLPPA
jgi:insertion element IS1 protein InsB